MNCKIRVTSVVGGEPVLVQISRLNINPPSNLELDEIILQKEIKQHLKEIA